MQDFFDNSVKKSCFYDDFRYLNFFFFCTFSRTLTSARRSWSLIRGPSSRSLAQQCSIANHCVHKNATSLKIYRNLSSVVGEGTIWGPPSHTINIQAEIPTIPTITTIPTTYQYVLCTVRTPNISHLLYQKNGDRGMQ